MYMDQDRIRCAFIRGGTSKGAFLLAKDLPSDPTLRDQIILAIYGSPDPRQIDGLGGADSLTSKVAIISTSPRDDADIDYTFGQVSINSQLIDYKGNCGNMSSGVGPFAVDEGLVPAVEPITQVRIYNTNTKKIIVADVPVKDGKALVEGDCSIDGVPGTGSRIMLDFLDSGGSVTGKLLPTGNVIDTINVEGRSYTVSFVDAANPAVFVHAEEVGLRGTELASEIDGNSALLEELERIRSAAAERLGFVADRRDGTRLSPAVPKMTIVSRPQRYMSSKGEIITEDSIDLTARIMSMQKAHKAYAVTGAVVTAAAARIPGTVVNEVYRQREGSNLVRIGHTSGRFTLEIIVEEREEGIYLKRAAVERTARRIMDGYVYVPKSKMK
jgi:methylitaconate Delta-isomerase